MFYVECGRRAGYILGFHHANLVYEVDTKWDLDGIPGLKFVDSLLKRNGQLLILFPNMTRNIPEQESDDITNNKLHAKSVL